MSGSSPSPSQPQARPEPVWTRRQREVLDLLVRGRTNPEIAQALGISLDGAKWHVSEVITKLGVDSRDDAAEYWRAHTGLRLRFTRILRALVPITWLKVGAGVAVAVGALAAVSLIVLALRDRPPGPAVPTSAIAGRTLPVPMVERSFHTATALSDGRVLIVGGNGQSGLVRQAEIYDPQTGQSTSAASLTIPRQTHSATRLLDGKVLIAGGVGDGGLQAVVGSAELYDPATDTFRLTGTLNEPRVAHAAVLTSAGQVLIVGGIGASGQPVATIEVFDPTTGQFSVFGSLPASVAGADQLAPLKDGRILAVGASGAALIDATSGQISLVIPVQTGGPGRLNQWPQGATATTLKDGRVLLAGGSAVGGASATAAAAVYDPASNELTALPPMNGPRSRPVTTVLKDGRVLLTGGIVKQSEGAFEATDLVELFDPVANRFTAETPMLAVRANHTATLLDTGTVLIVGTFRSFSQPAEAYDP